MYIHKYYVLNERLSVWNIIQRTNKPLVWKNYKLVCTYLHIGKTNDYKAWRLQTDCIGTLFLEWCMTSGKDYRNH